MDSPEADPALAAAQSLCAQHVPALKALHVWASDYGPGLEIVTSHYRIFTTLLDPAFLLYLPQFMESAHAAYNGFLAEAVSPQAQSIIYVFAQRSQWESFTHAFAGEQAAVLCRIRQGAYCHKGACVAYDIGRDRTFAALAHEGWHQFMTRHFAFRLPSWLDEGLAMSFESFSWDQDGCHFCSADNAYRLEGLQFQLTKPSVLSLEDLLRASPGEMMAQDNTQSVIGFYSQSYALVRFLSDGSSPHREGFRRLLSDGQLARWPLDVASRHTAADRNQPRTLAWNRKVGVQLFRQYIGADLERIEKHYLAYCQKLVKTMDPKGAASR
jgi:hypothetical protein